MVSWVSMRQQAMALTCNSSADHESTPRFQLTVSPQICLGYFKESMGYGGRALHHVPDEAEREPAELILLQ